MFLTCLQTVLFPRFAVKGCFRYLGTMSVTKHLQKPLEHEHQRVRCWVITVSDTRDKAKDTTGRYIKTALRQAGHRVEHYTIILDDEGQISRQLEAAKSDPDVQAVILTGGTGISKRDVTVKVVQRLVDETLDGFGELFRFISYQEIGPFALMSRAMAGVMAGKLVYALPGSENAVHTAMEKLLLPTLKHAAFELTK